MYDGGLNFRGMSNESKQNTGRGDERVCLGTWADGECLGDTPYKEMQCDGNSDYAYRTKESSSKENRGEMSFEGENAV